MGLVHVALVAPLYHVGSFDDDAGYILTAKTLLAGGGLRGHLASGQVVVGLYPPGYSAVIAPLVWIWPHWFVPLRLFSLACYAALFPLLWLFMVHRRVGPGARLATLVLLALGPPLATFATMVMAEAPYLVVLLLLLLALDRWRAEPRLLGGAGVATIVAAAALIWLKQAGVGLVAGLVLWLLYKNWRRAVLVAGGVGLTLVPVIAARLAAGIPLAGALYSSELGGFYQGGLLSRLQHVLPSSGLHLLSTAIPATLVPYLEPLPIRGHWPDLWKVLSWHVTILIVVGAVRWQRRHRDAAVAMVVVYLLESILWPFVNERRAILVVPLLTLWYVTGAVAAAQALRRALRLDRARVRPVAATAAAVAVVAAVAAPLVAQAPRDYLFGWGRSSSRPEGSRYASILSRIGPPSVVVETDYRETTALFTGHRTAWTAFTVSLGGLCYLPGIMSTLGSDGAGFLLVGNLNRPAWIDNACLATTAYGAPWAVRLLYTSRDNASVFELIGPDTGHPDLVNALAGSRWSMHSGGAVSSAEWDFPATRQISQVSLGEAAASAGGTTSVALQLRRSGGSWTTAALARGAVGDGGSAPYLLASFPRPVAASALRVVVTGSSPGGDALMGDVAALGPAPPGAA